MGKGEAKGAETGPKSAQKSKQTVLFNAMLGLDMREIVRDIRAEEGPEREQLFAINPLIVEWPLPFRF